MGIDVEARNRWLTSATKALGISRVADTTGLDRLGIPTSAAVRPGTTDTIWVYSGKGLTTPESRVTAIMESVERTSAVWSCAWSAGTEIEARRRVGAAWGHRRFTERETDNAPECSAWVVGHDFGTGEPVAVPADLVFTGHRPPDAPESVVAVRTSNGLAAGFTRDEAMGAALLEVIERDVVSLHELTAGHFAAGVLARLSANLGIDATAVLNRFKDDGTATSTVDPTTAPPPLPELAGRFEAAGLQLVLRSLPNEFELPVFAAAAAEQLDWDTVLATAGYGVGGDPVAAATRALLELAQSRATDRQGAREDCGVGEKSRLDRLPSGHWLLEPAPPQPWAAVAGTRQDITVEIVLGRLRRAGLADVAVVDLPAPAGLFAVRVLVPEIETWHPTGGLSRLGSRASVRLKQENVREGKGVS